MEGAKMKVEKLHTTIEQQAEQEYSAHLSARAKAIEDYNIMMGNIEDPAEGEEDGTF